MLLTHRLLFVNIAVFSYTTPIIHKLSLVHAMCRGSAPHRSRCERVLLFHSFIVDLKLTCPAVLSDCWLFFIHCDLGQILYRSRFLKVCLVIVPFRCTVD